MHSTSRRPSLSQRCGELPGMPGKLGAPLRWPQLQLVLAPILLLVPVVLFVRKQLGRPKQRRWVWQSRKGQMVATRLIRAVHADRGARAHSSPRGR
jgi:hypothetical protein